MKHSIEIRIEFWADESQNGIPKEHQEQLKAHAEERIYEMRKDFYTSGELNYEVGGIYYNGIWDFKETEN